MAVLIKSMEMPTGCISCDFCNPFVEEPYCRRLMKRVPKVTRLDNCPLIEVPEPHGRLIDASEAYDKIAEQEGGNYVDMDAVGIGLDETPTVIPSSKEE